jgi:superfamily I DNA/RNA helicase
MKHTEFWKKYALLEGRDAQAFLKTYLFSLSPEEMKTWILSETKNLVSELKKDFDDPSVNKAWKQKINSDLRVATSNLAHQKQANFATKVA